MAVVTTARTEPGAASDIRIRLARYVPGHPISNSPARGVTMMSSPTIAQRPLEHDEKSQPKVSCRTDPSASNETFMASAASVKCTTPGPGHFRRGRVERRGTNTVVIACRGGATERRIHRWCRVGSSDVGPIHASLMGEDETTGSQHHAQPRASADDGSHCGLESTWHAVDESPR